MATTVKHRSASTRHDQIVEKTSSMSSQIPSKPVKSSSGHRPPKTLVEKLQRLLFVFSCEVVPHSVMTREEMIVATPFYIIVAAILVYTTLIVLPRSIVSAVSMLTFYITGSEMA